MQVKVTVTLEPEGSVGMVKPPCCSPVNDRDWGGALPPGHTAPPVVVVHCAAVQLSPGTAGSVKSVPSAAEGPLLLTTMVYVVVAPEASVSPV